MRVLIVRLSSLGDVVHSLPVVHDILAADPQAQIDWVCAPAYVPLLRRVRGVRHVIAADAHRWRKTWWRGQTRAQWSAFVERVRQDEYDAVIDLQGVTESALVARQARGRRYGVGNATEGVAWEKAARWLVDRPLAVDARMHAIDQARVLVAQALERRAEGPPVHGLIAAPRSVKRDQPRAVAFVHGSAHEARLWPATNWIALGKRVVGADWRIVLPQRGEVEATRAEMIASSFQFERQFSVEVWPEQKLDQVVDRLASTFGVIGVDSGLSHLAVALNLPHVQIHNQASAWRSGPQPQHGHRIQVALEARPTPTVEDVWAAWNGVLKAAHLAP